MLTLSAGKILLLIVVIGAVIFGTRLFRTLGRPQPQTRREPPRGPDAAEPTTFERCPRCGAYVDPRAHRCTGGEDRSETRGPG